MTSMTNITEAKRVRDQLAASHERFTTVLEGLDASVSVLSVRQGELLFANRSYRAVVRRRRARPRAAGRPARRQPSPAPSADEAVDDLSGLPTQELTDSGGRAARDVRAEAREVVRGALALPAVDRRQPRADAHRHRHHLAPPRRGAVGPAGREGGQSRAAS
jgi:PAS domain-containing protein